MPNVKLKLKEFEKNLPNPSGFWIFQQLLHPIAFSVILMLYDVIIGKILLVILQKLHLLSIPVYKEEKHGGKPDELFTKFPNALAILSLNQLKKLNRFNRQRQEIAQYYSGKKINGIYLRYSILVDKPQELIKKAKERGVLLGNWYHNVIDPAGVDLEKVGYTKGSCPKAENAAAHIVNLPTRISKAQAKYVRQSITR